MIDNPERPACSEFGDISDSELAQALEEVSKSLASIMIKRKVSQEVMLGGVLSFLMGLSASGHGDNDQAGRELRKMSDYFLQTGVYAPPPKHVVVVPLSAISKRSVNH